MPRASKKKVDHKLQTEIFSNFSDLISMLKNSGEINIFLETFLTKEEKMMVSKRLMLYLMFDKNYKVNNIASILRMSRVTVLKHRNKWYKENNAFKLLMSNLLKKRKTKEIWNAVEDLFYPLDLIARSRTDMKARAKLYSGDFKRQK